MSRPYAPFEPDYLTGDAAAEFLGLQRSCWQRAVVKGNVIRHHPGGTKRGYFAREELERLKCLRIDWSDAASIAAGYAVVLSELRREND